MRAALLALLLLCAGRAEAQTCTANGGTPLTSANTPTVAGIDAKVDAATNGQVLCLRRGNTWTTSGSETISFGTNHPGASRVTICASDDTQCTETTGAGVNPRINATTQLFSIPSSSGGYNWRGIDLYCTGGCGGSGSTIEMLGVVGFASHDFLFGGAMIWDGWPHIGYFQAYISCGSNCITALQEPDVFQFGDYTQSGGLIEMRNFTHSDDGAHIWYGIVDHLTIDGTWIHHYGSNHNTGGRGHVLDMTDSCYGAGDGSTTGASPRSSDHIVLKNSRWEVSAGYEGGGMMMRAQNASDLSIHDNWFGVTGTIPGCSATGLDLSKHSDNPPWSCGANANDPNVDVYRNTFKFGNCSQVAFHNSNGTDVKFHDNVIDMRDITTVNGDFYGNAITKSPRANALGTSNNFWVYNNTIYAPDLEENQLPSKRIQFCAGCGTGHRIINNLIVDGQANNLATPVEINGDCNAFGANGVDIRNNWVQSTNDSTPTMPDCSAATPEPTGFNGFLPSSGWNLSGANPGMVDAPNGNFTITTGSAVYKQGTATGGDPFDYTGGIRPSPPSIGAYDVVDGVAPETLTVTAPNGGETWTADTTATLFWSTGSVFPNVKVEISTTGCTGTFSTLIVSTPNDGSQTVTVPDTASVTACVRISDANDGVPSDVSDAVFTIAAGPEAVTLVTPNGAEGLVVGTSYDITWTHDPGATFANVKLDLSTTGCAGAFSVAISASTPNDGSFTWTVPNNPGTSSCVRVQDAADATPSDVSNAVFTISALDAITVTYPNGGESLGGSQIAVVRWTKIGTGVSFVKVELSTTGCGGAFSTLLGSTLNDGAEIIFVPDTATVSACLRIGDTDGTPIDSSDAVWTITAATAAPTVRGGGLFR